MNAILTVINILTKKERIDFITMLKQKNKRHDIKNVKLFRLIEQNSNMENIDVLLYGKPAKGAYHALSKRLFDSLIDFVATKNFEAEQSDEMEVIKLLLASRVLFEQKAHKVAFRIKKSRV